MIALYDVASKHIVPGPLVRLGAPLTCVYGILSFISY